MRCKNLLGSTYATPLFLARLYQVAPTSILCKPNLAEPTIIANPVFVTWKARLYIDLQIALLYIFPNGAANTTLPPNMLAPDCAQTYS